MANKLTLPEYNEVKNRSVCVVAFKNGKRAYTYGNLSYKEALDHVFQRQAQGEICLILPSSNGNGINGLEVRPYKEEEDTLTYYLGCLQTKQKTEVFISDEDRAMQVNTEIRPEPNIISDRRK